jgi:class 3 adenylate cyclase
MGWSYDRSLKRIGAHLEGMGQISVEKLKRAADLWSLLSETNCREIFGAHAYVDVSNFPSLASAGSATNDDLKRLVQSVHLYQREVARIVEREDMFDGLRVHFQGARLHALFYRPIDNKTELATRALLLQLVLRDFVNNVFNPAFPKLGNFRTAAGVDVGDTVATQNGVEGDRELLFLGGPANKAAKILGDPGSNRLTNRVFDALPEDLQTLCLGTDDTDVYAVGDIEQSTLDALCAKYDIAWNREDSRERLDDDRKQFPLSEIAIETAEALIDLDLLSIRRNKRVLATSLFADLTGFTAYIERAEDADKQKEALRVLHAVRKEFTRVLTDDFDCVRIQYQGDRVQAIGHLPTNDAAAIARWMLHAAAGVQSSMEATLKSLLPEASGLTVAIGVDSGLALVSRLGTRGARDPICLGTAVEKAARIEEAVDGREIGVSSNVHALLPEQYQELFAWRKAAQCYVASALTIDKLERADDAAKMYGSSAAVYVKTTAGVTTVTGEVTSGGRPVVPATSFAG